MLGVNEEVTPRRNRALKELAKTPLDIRVSAMPQTKNMIHPTIASPRHLLGSARSAMLPIVSAALRSYVPHANAGRSVNRWRTALHPMRATSTAAVSAPSTVRKWISIAVASCNEGIPSSRISSIKSRSISPLSSHSRIGLRMCVITGSLIALRAQIAAMRR
jgi:hypothetical protein